MSQLIEVFIDDATEARLQKSSEETGRGVDDLASSAISEYVLGIWRGRADDPAEQAGLSS